MITNEMIRTAAIAFSGAPFPSKRSLRRAEAALSAALSLMERQEAREISREMMDAGQKYLDARALRGNFVLPATFRWTEFWDAMIAARPTQGEGE